MNLSSYICRIEIPAHLKFCNGFKCAQESIRRLCRSSGLKPMSSCRMGQVIRVVVVGRKDRLQKKNQKHQPLKIIQQKKNEANGSTPAYCIYSKLQLRCQILAIYIIADCNYVTESCVHKHKRLIGSKAIQLPFMWLVVLQLSKDKDKMRCVSAEITSDKYIECASTNICCFYVPLI